MNNLLKFLIVILLISAYCLALPFEDHGPPIRCCGNQRCHGECIPCPANSHCGINIKGCPYCDYSSPFHKCCGVGECAGKCLYCKDEGLCSVMPLTGCPKCVTLLMFLIFSLQFYVFYKKIRKLGFYQLYC